MIHYINTINEKHFDNINIINKIPKNILCNYCCNNLFDFYF